jgi:hypothetical protein
VRQAALFRSIVSALPSVLKRVETEMVAYYDFDPEFRQFVRNPQVCCHHYN